MKRSIKSRIKKRASRGKSHGRETDQIISEKVYVVDDLPEETEIRVVRQSVAVFGGVVIRRFFIKRGGVEKELLTCADCPIHLVTEDHKENYCALPVGEFEIKPEFLKTVGSTQMCTHICALKKKMYKELLSQLEKWDYRTAEVNREKLKKYLNTPFTRHKNNFELPIEDVLRLWE